jgi:hypothetical protein
MKKKTVALLIVAVLFTALAGGVIAYYLTEHGPETYIAVVSDTHIFAESYFTDSETYEYYSGVDKMIHLSEAIAKTIVDDLISDKRITTVLVAGDLTERGDLASHLAVARIFQKLVDNGKQVFVINGNHDLRDSVSIGENIPSARFREIYFNLGYKQALVKDTDSLSYTADIGKSHRLIAIDNDDYFSSDTDTYKSELDDRLLTWCEAQLKQCQKDKKTPIIMAHKPFLNHFPAVAKKLVSGGGTEGGEYYDRILDIFMQYGVPFTLTGHNHIQSVATAFGEDKVIYDIGTGSSVYYPGAHRILSITKSDYKFEAVFPQRINMSYVHPFTSAEDYAKIEANFPLYAEEHCAKGITFLNALTSSYMIPSFNLTGDIAQIVGLLADNALAPLLRMPLYEKDADGEESLQSIVKQYGKDIPPSRYTSLTQFVASVIMGMNRGEQDIGLDSVEIKLLNNAIFALFHKINELKDDIAGILPDAPVLELDIERLYEDNELELLDSNFLEFGVAIAGDLLPFQIDAGNLSDLTSIKLLIKPMLNAVMPGLGDSIGRAIGSKEINVQILLNEVLYDLLLKDILHNEGNNNVIINRKTQELRQY